MRAGTHRRFTIIQAWLLETHKGLDAVFIQASPQAGHIGPTVKNILNSWEIDLDKDNWSLAESGRGCYHKSVWWMRVGKLLQLSSILAF